MACSWRKVRISCALKLLAKAEASKKKPKTKADASVKKQRAKAPGPAKERRAKAKGSAKEARRGFKGFLYWAASYLSFLTFVGPLLVACTHFSVHPRWLEAS